MNKEQLQTNKIINDDCLNALKYFPDNSIDFIITSPPYADNRMKTYGGIKPEAYTEWFMPISDQLLRVLKPTGTFILNIKEKVVNGERSTYVLDLILTMREHGWLWTEEFIWHKKNSFPGRWPNRFRDSWERCLQFNKNRKFNAYQDAVKIPIGSWADTRLKKLSITDNMRDEAKNNSGFGKKVSNWVEKKWCTQRMFFISLQNAQTNNIVLLFLKIFLDGSLSFLRSQGISYWILLLVLVQRLLLH